jgi:YVTN family beta-propeller protein
VAVQTDEVVIDEARFPGRQGRLVFAYLVAEQGRPVPRDELAEALWGEAPPATWDKALTVLVSKLRSLLADGGDGANALTSAFGCYRLDLPGGTWIDVIAATDAAREAERALATGDLAAAKAAAELAAAVLGQPFLPGQEGVWVDEKRRQFADVRDRALSVLSEASLRSGEATEAVRWAEQTVALAPFRETGYRQLMEAHVAAGNRAEALRVYEQCRRLLADELGTYPSPETESIYRGLLEKPPVVTRTASASAPRPEEAVAPRRGGGRRVVVILACGVLAATVAVVGALVLLAREGSGPAPVAVAADSVGVFEPGEGRPSRQIPLGASPSAVTAGAGSIWVANVDAHSVTRIDAARQGAIDTVPVGDGPNGIAFGGGFVWVTNGLDGTVSQIDPQTDTVVKTIAVGHGPAGVAVGAGRVWVANSDDGTVTPIELRTGKPLRPIPVDQSADGVAVGFDSVWVTSEATGDVTRIDARSRSIVASKQTGSGADAVAAGPDGVWVANRLDGTVTRIDPATNRVAATIPVGDGPNAVAVTADAVWVSNELAGTFTKIDPHRNIPVATVTIGKRPEGIALDSGSLFVPVRASGAGHRGGTLSVLTTSRDLLHVDPARTFTPEEQQVVALTNDGLTGFRRVGGHAGTKLAPDLAVSLPAPTYGGRAYTFRLRPGIRYSTGALVRPEDFRRAIERSLVLSPARAYYGAIIGARRCLAAPKRPCDLSSGIVTEPGSNTVTFRLTAPDPDFLYELALPAAFAVPARTPLHPRGFVPATGPYEVASFDPKRAIRLVRNPSFREWSQAAQPSGFPDAIVERFGGSAAARVAAVLHGSADLATNLVTLSPAALASVRTRHASRLEANPWNVTWFLGLDTRVAPFDDIRVRRALNFAVDRRRLSDLALGPGFGRVTCQVLPPSFDGYQRYCPYTTRPSANGVWSGTDLKRARELVRASGTAGEAVTVWIAKPIPIGRAGGAYVVSVLDSLGYKARLRIVADPVSERNKLHLQLGFWGWSADFPLPASFIATALACDVSFRNGNTAEFCNRTIDREIARAESLRATDPDQASRLWAEIDRDVTDEAPWVAYANGVKLEVKSARVGNYQYSPQGGTLLDQLWLR